MTEAEKGKFAGETHHAYFERLTRALNDTPEARSRLEKMGECGLAREVWAEQVRQVKAVEVRSIPAKENTDARAD